MVASVIACFAVICFQLACHHRSPNKLIACMLLILAHTIRPDWDLNSDPCC